MAVRQASRASLSFSPHPLQQLWGALLCAGAVFFMLSLLTHNPLDPSFNRASPNPAANAGGALGAHLSDLALQTVGLASLLLALIPAAWGVKMIAGRPLRHLWLRFTLLLLALTCLAPLLSLIDLPGEEWFAWAGATGLGGAVGKLLLEAFQGWFRSWAFTAALSLITLAIVVCSFGLSLVEWRALGNRLRQAAMVAYALLFSVLALTRRRREEKDGEEFPRPWYRRLPFLRKSPESEWDEDADEEEEDGEGKDGSPRPLPRITKTQKKTVEKGERSVTPRAQSSLALSHGDFTLPPHSLLSPIPRAKKHALNEAALAQNARLLESVLRDFGVNGEILEIRPGPVVTLYELEPAAGTKSSRVIGLADDVARSMSAVSARIAVIPGRNAIGIELPNATRETVFLRELLESEAFESDESKLPLALGKDIGGAAVVVDLSRMPHLLVAGTTGSGKSVAINTMIMSLVYRLTPDECKFIMIDPKMLELSVYEGIPHLLSPVVTEPGKAVVALKWTVKEMENRYRQMSNLGVRNIDGYNKKIREAKAKGKQLSRTVQTGFDPESGQPIVEEVPLEMVDLPYIVVVVDEMADLMLVAGKDIETSVQRLAQMARAAGIHIIMATQRPSVDVITGVIKANFPTRISFQVTSRIDSRTILGEQGAEQLLGQGDMLHMAGGGRISRVHGPFVSDKEVEKVVAHLKEQGTPAYIEDITRDEEEEALFEGGEGEKDELYDQAVTIVCRDRKASTSYVQRCLKVGYNRAASIIERMEREGIVGPANHVGKREVLARNVEEA